MMINETFEQLLDRLYMMDFEVTSYDWLLVIKKYRTKEKTIFHNSNADKVQSFIDKHNPIFIGHNLAYYDKYILKAILSGFSMSEIKSVNDHIIQGGQGFELQYEYVELPPCWDTIQDVVPMKSLKEIEANLLLDITESTIDFNINHKWNEKEYEEMLYYCEKDVDALFPLFEARISYFETKYDICVLSNLEPSYNIGLTNAKLCAKFLEAEREDRDDERDYKIPKTIDTNMINPKILDFFSKIHDKNIPSEVLFKTKLEFEEHGMPTVVSWGGKHGALPNFKYDVEETPDMILINCDYASLYPHLLALPQYNFISRNIKDKNKYYDTLQHRLELKKQGKKKEQLALKLILNTTYGCELNKYNDLYDARGARSTCISGQMLISELTERVYTIGNVTPVQVNTDGLMVLLPKNKLEQYYKVCNDYSKQCGIELEYDIISKIVQRDVNNYIMCYEDKGKIKIKAKGGCFATLPELIIQPNGDIVSEYKPNFKANSLAIVSEALAKNLLFDIPISKTIIDCNDKAKFQVVSHLGSTYEKCVQESENGDILLQRNNRIYAGKTPSGKIIKVKYDGRRDSLANQPENPIIDNNNCCTINDIDKNWYIKLATQWANDFKGVKRLENYKKDELLELAKNRGLEVDKKIKKDELIKMIEVDIEREDINQMPIKDNIEITTKKTEIVNTIRHNGNHFDDITNKRYGHLIVLGLDHIDKHHKSYWLCKCDCGNEFVRAKSRIRLGRTNTCGKCDYFKFERKTTTTHGDSPESSPNHRLYNIWNGMRKRCYLKTHKYYPRYGGRGIIICNEWLGSDGYVNFKEWALLNGYKNNLTIERKDYNGNYCPENCCWVTMLEQHKNTSKVIKINYNGKIYTLNEFCKKYHTSPLTVKKYIINSGMNVNDYIKHINQKNIEKGND